MDIRSVHADLVTRLATLAITAPVTASIKRVYKYVPKLSAAITDYPCIFLTYGLESLQFMPSFTEQQYSIHIQMFIGKAAAEQDITADVASAFLDALVTKLSQSQRLGGTVSVIRGLRGASPDTLTGLEWAGVGFVGLDLFLDVTLKESAVHAA
jgi:hypothetical protein